MEIQGVVFYSFNGDHPQCGPRKLRLGIPGTRADVATFRRLLCQVHDVDVRRYKVEIQHFTTREVLADSGDVKSYDELRVICTRKVLKDVLQDEQRQLLQKDNELQEDRERQVLAALRSHETPATVGTPGTLESSPKEQAKDDPRVLAKMSKLSSLTFPLAPKALKQLIERQMKTLEGEQREGSQPQCFLCGLDEWDPVTLTCCSKSVCRQCVAYAKTLMRRSDGSVCPVCSTRDELETPKAEEPQTKPLGPHVSTSAVKRESAGSSIAMAAATASTQPSLRSYSDEVSVALQQKLLGDAASDVSSGLWMNFFESLPGLLHECYREGRKRPRCSASQ